MTSEDRFEKIRSYFAHTLAAHGSTPRGVDYNSTESQFIRFEQLLKIVEPGQPFSILDYGCGFGALIDLLIAKNWDFTYLGYDISQEMIAEAIKNYRHLSCCRFTSLDSDLPVMEYVVESGIFNVRFDESVQGWGDYVLATLNKMNALSSKGFSFNMLTKYSDPERMRTDLY